jgi:hypothetical protein
MVVMVSFVLMEVAVIMSMMAAEASPVTSVDPLEQALVEGRSLSVVQSCLRLRRELTGEGQYARGCGSGTLQMGTARNCRGNSRGCTEDGEDVERLVRLAIGKLQDLLHSGDVVFDQIQPFLHLIGQGRHVEMEFLHGNEKIVETTFVDGIKVL